MKTVIKLVCKFDVPVSILRNKPCKILQQPSPFKPQNQKKLLFDRARAAKIELSLIINNINKSKN